MSGEPRLISNMLIDEAKQIDDKIENKEHLTEIGFMKKRTRRNGKNVYIIVATESAPYK